MIHHGPVDLRQSVSDEQMSTAHGLAIWKLEVPAVGVRPGVGAERNAAGGADPAEEGVRRPGFLVDHLGLAFLHASGLHAGRDAFESPDQRISYGELEGLITTLRARLLGDADFHPGDRVVLWLPNGVEYIVAFYAVLLAGGVVVPTPPDQEAGRFREILRLCGARRILTTEQVLRKRPAPAGAQVSSLLLSPEPLRDGAVLDFEILAGGDAPAAIFFTSGTSGVPKGVTLSHRNLLANTDSIQRYLAISHTERPLCLLPFYHAFGNSILQSHLLAGATLVLDGSLSFPESVVGAIAERRATSLSGVPNVFQTLLSRSSLGQADLPSLRTVTVAGGRLDPDLTSVLAFRVAPARLFVMYGQTEATARLSFLDPDELERRFGSIGKGIPGVELQVVNEQGRPIQPGELGEVRARGANIMQGYWNDPDGTAEVVRDGWLHTGDLATIDDDGFIYPRGRRSGFVKIAGFRVHPAEIESFIRREADVLAAVVVAYPDASGETRLGLFVQPWDDQDELSVDHLRRLCAASLPRYQVPAYVEILPEFPVTNSQKIDHRALADRAARLSARA